MPRHRRRHKKTANPPHDQGPREGDSTAGLEDEYYDIKHSDTLGRYLVARRDIAEGTVIISEDPLVVGPVPDSPPVCLGCYKELPDIQTAERCKTCSWPLCSNKCKGLYKVNGHSKEECLQLVKCPIESSIISKHQRYNAIFPLRCLLLREHQPEKWRILTSMEAHDDARRRRNSICDYNQKSIVDRITKEWNLDKYTELEIHTVCGYTEVNAFSIGVNSINIQGLYPRAFLIAHDCVANTSHTDDEEFQMKIFASVKLSKGDMMSLSYTNSLQCTYKRREHLRRCKFFECSCKRCCDPTELGTYLSAVKCRECSSGRVIPTEPLRDEADWRCDNGKCNQAHLAIDIHNVNNRIENEIKSLDQESVEEVEAALRRYSALLCSNQYHVVGLKYTLSQLYGKSSGFLISQMSDAMLQRKIQICEDILKVFDIVEPGFTRIRGLTMYELHAPLMILTMKNSERGNISKVDLTRNLKRVAFYLRECIRVLKFEPQNTQEEAIRRAAEEGLMQLKSWEPAVGKL